MTNMTNMINTIMINTINITNINKTHLWILVNHDMEMVARINNTLHFNCCKITLPNPPDVNIRTK